MLCLTICIFRLSKPYQAVRSFLLMALLCMQCYPSREDYSQIWKMCKMSAPKLCDLPSGSYPNSKHTVTV